MSRQEGLSRIWRNGWMRLQNMFKEANLSMRCSAEFLMDSHGESHLKNQLQDGLLLLYDLFGDQPHVIMIYPDHCFSCKGTLMQLSDPAFIAGWLGRRSTSPHVWYRKQLPGTGLRVRECLTLRFLRHKAEMSKRSSKKWPAASPEKC